MTSTQDETLAAKRRRAAWRAAAFFLVGALGTLAAIGASLLPHPLPASGGLVLLEAVALIAFFRFGWWISHLRTLERRISGASYPALADESLFW